MPKRGLEKYPVNSSGYDYTKTATFVGGYAKEADALRREILDTPNTEEIYPITGRKYYISKEQPLTDVPTDLHPGDAVLFERGGLWRVGWKETFRVPAGVTFGSYGKGDKPKLYGSVRNWIDAPWEKESEHLYKTVVTGGNPGIIVFDEVAALGVKKWTLEDVKSNYDFYYAPDETMYLYYEGDLTADFDSIEIGQRGKIVKMSDDSTLDNICLRYTGSHAVAAGDQLKNVSVTNCEIGFIGGSQQFKQVRFGNGVELQLGSINSKVSHNWVYQCYDAGVTFQSWNTGRETNYHGVEFSDNLIEFCDYGIEYFTTGIDCEGGSYSDYKNIHLTGNVIRFSGYEWSFMQRPDKWMNSHIRGGQWAWVPDTEDFLISGNVFDCSRANIIFWWWHDPEREKPYIHPEPHAGLTVRDNTYFQAQMPDKRCLTFHVNKPIYAEDEAGVRAALTHFDSAPAAVTWIERMCRE